MQLLVVFRTQSRHPDTVQDHEITIVADLVPHEYVKVSEVEEIGTDPVQDHVTAEMVFEAENLRLTKKNYWPLLRKMQLGCLVPITLWAWITIV